MSTLILFLIVIIILVVAHELGHFFVAKWCGVHVEEFGIGYPPRAKKLFRWKGTLFTLNWIPFGGFVKIFGEEGADVSPRSFSHQKLWKRLLIIIAGVVANILLAMVLYTASFSIGFLGSQSDFPNSISVSPQQVLVTNVLKGSPAQEAGIISGDTITTLSVGTDSVQIQSAKDVTTFVQAHPSSSISATLLRKNEIHTVSLFPEILEGSSTPALGVGIAEATRIRLPFSQAVYSGVTHTLYEFKNTVMSFGKLFGGLFSKGESLISQVSGPVGIAQFAAQSYGFGIGSLLSFMAFISVNLAFINLLPIPALDGGRFIIELFSSGGKSRIPARVISGVQKTGFLLLILLMIYVTYNDIARLFT